MSKSTPLRSELARDRQQQNKDFNELYKLGSELGVGSDSVVYECRHLSTSEKCAVKISDITKIDTRMIEEECALLKLISHQNIIKSHGVFYVRNKIHLVIELVEGEELHEIINQTGGLAEEDAVPLIYQLLSAVSYLHENNICHRDIKPENILISDDGTLKLIDFGLAVNLKGTDGMMRACVGTQAYQAPEVLIGLPYNQGIDMWAVGATTFTLLSGSKPFGYGPHQNDRIDSEGPTQEQKSHQRAKILNGDFSLNDPVWNNISTSAKSFVVDLLKVRPSDRITPQVALEHTWITSYEIDLRSFQYKWRSKSRDRREVARKEKREKMYELKAAQRKQTNEEEDRSEPLSPLRSYASASTVRETRSRGVSQLPGDTSRDRPISSSTSYRPHSDNERISDRSDRSNRLDRLDRSDPPRTSDRTRDRPLRSTTSDSNDRASLSLRSNYTPSAITSRTPGVARTATGGTSSSRTTTTSTLRSPAPRKYR